MQDNFDSIEKLRFIHGLMKKEVEELIKFISSSKVNLAETNSPAVDMVVNDDEIIIFAELAGLTTNDFTVYQYDDLVVIEGVRPREKRQNVSYIRVEREAIRFKRVLKLPMIVNDNEAKAKLRDGVLEIRISKTPCTDY